DEVVLVAGISGVVSYTEKSVLPGMQVRKSEVLLSLISKGMADDNFALRYAEAKSRYELAKSAYERQKALAAEQVISTAEFQKAKSDYEVALAAFKAFENGYSAEGQQIVSPANAEVLKVFVSNGDYVNAGQPLVKLSKLSVSSIQCYVQPRFLNLLSSISDANIRVNSSGMVVNLKSSGGRLAAVGRTISSENHLIPVVLELPNVEVLPVGEVVDVYLLCQPKGNSLTVPVSALLEEQGNHFVMVQLTPETFIKREVKLGVTDGSRVEVLSGLQPGNRIVIRGAVYVKMAQSSGALDAHSGHVH
ncbi:MAG TPA: efflux RND transporter periplasmic adaptor subunit, partial [Tenuifilum sp.]|nr:efflux RND transporter periplasmic adaptor subunit [Tenuifilum sp.]